MGTPRDGPDIAAMDPIKILSTFGCAESRMRLLFEAKNLDTFLSTHDLNNVCVQFLRQKNSSR